MQWNPAWVDICLLGSTRYSDCSLSFKIQCFITFNIRIFPHLVLLPYNLDELTYWFDITIPIVEIKLIPKLSFLRFMASGPVLSPTHVGVDRNPRSHFYLDFYILMVTGWWRLIVLIMKASWTFLFVFTEYFLSYNSEELPSPILKKAVCSF